MIDVAPNSIFSAVWWLQPEIQIHSRTVYGWLNLMGSLGGITNVIMLLFTWLVVPINEHSFVLKAAYKLYFARTKENDLFKDRKDPKGEIETNSKSTKRELSYHRVIKMKPVDNFLLYFRHRLGCFGFLLDICWKKSRKFEKLYSET